MYSNNPNGPRPSPLTASPTLIIQPGSPEAREFQLPPPPASVSCGRGANCDIRFDPQRARVVGREHARFEVRVDGVYLRDLNSANGTFLRGSPVNGEVQLFDGDEVQLAEGGPIIRVVFQQRQEMDSTAVLSPSMLAENAGAQGQQMPAWVEGYLKPSAPQARPGREQLQQQPGRNSVHSRQTQQLGQRQGQQPQQPRAESLWPGSDHMEMPPSNASYQQPSYGQQPQAPQGRPQQSHPQPQQRNSRPAQQPAWANNEAVQHQNTPAWLGGQSQGTQESAFGSNQSPAPFSASQSMGQPKGAAPPRGASPYNQPGQQYGHQAYPPQGQTFGNQANPQGQNRGNQAYQAGQSPNPPYQAGQPPNQPYQAGQSPGNPLYQSQGQASGGQGFGSQQQFGNRQPYNPGASPQPGPRSHSNPAAGQPWHSGGQGMSGAQPSSFPRPAQPAPSPALTPPGTYSSAAASSSPASDAAPAAPWIGGQEGSSALPPASTAPLASGREAEREARDEKALSPSGRKARVFQAMWISAVLAAACVAGLMTSSVTAPTTWEQNVGER